MSVAIKRELIEDNLEVTDFVSAEPLKKKVRTARKCTGVGGKLPREPIKSKPLRKVSLPVAPVRIVPMRSVRTRSKPLVQTIQDSDDSDIEFLDDSALSEYEKNRSNNIKERYSMFKKSDKNNINNNSSKSEDKPDIEVIDENDDDIICDSDMNTELDIICEPDINIEVNDQESTEIEVIDFSENPDTSKPKTKTPNDVNSNAEIIEENNDVICEPDIDNLKSNSEEVTEIEVIEDSKTSTDTKDSMEKSNSKKSSMNDKLTPVTDEALDIEVIDYTIEDPLQKEDIVSKSSTELTDIEENLMDSFPQLITL